MYTLNKRIHAYNDSMMFVYILLRNTNILVGSLTQLHESSIVLLVILFLLKIVTQLFGNMSSKESIQFNPCVILLLVLG